MSAQVDGEARLEGEAWESYRSQVEQWHAQRSLTLQGATQRLIASDPRMSEPYRRGEYAGKSRAEVLVELRQSAARDQARYLLLLHQPRSAILDEEYARIAELARLRTTWGVFASPLWHDMTSAELRAHVATYASATASSKHEWARHDPDVIAWNRHEVVVNASILGKRNKRYTLADYIQDREEDERYPNETLLAEKLRRSAPYAFWVMVVGVIITLVCHLAGWPVTLGVAIAGAALGYLFLSRWLYPYMLSGR